MERPIRRVVTAHDATGKAVVLYDGAATNTRIRSVGGFVSTLLWATDASPAQPARDRDMGALQLGVAPPPNGSIFRIVDFPPVTGDLASIDHQKLIAEMGISDPGSAKEAPRHPFTHRTKSVDYAVVLSGEIDMLLDDSDVHLKAGDVVVQQGTNHAWVNRGSEVCRIAFILIDAMEG